MEWNVAIFCRILFLKTRFYAFSVFQKVKILRDWGQNAHYQAQPKFSHEFLLLKACSFSKRIAMSCIPPCFATSPTCLIAMMMSLLHQPVLFFVHLDPNFRGVFCLTLGRKWPNFGAKWAQLQKPTISPKFSLNLPKIEQILPILWANKA